MICAGGDGAAAAALPAEEISAEVVDDGADAPPAEEPANQDGGGEGDYDDSVDTDAQIAQAYYDRLNI